MCCAREVFSVMSTEMTKIFTYYKNSLKTRKSINFHKLAGQTSIKKRETLYLMTKDYFHRLLNLLSSYDQKQGKDIRSHHILDTEVLAFAIRQG